MLCTNLVVFYCMYCSLNVKNTKVVKLIVLFSFVKMCIILASSQGWTLHEMFRWFIFLFHVVVHFGLCSRLWLLFHARQYFPFLTSPWLAVLMICTSHCAPINLSLDISGHWLFIDLTLGENTFPVIGLCQGCYLFPLHFTFRARPAVINGNQAW